MKSPLRFITGLLTLAVLCLASAPLRASDVSVTGTYESEGSIVETVTDYTGPVSLRALLGLELDLALGFNLHREIPRVEIEQRDRTFTIRTKNAKGDTEWSAVWERNGGFEPTKEGGVKMLLRAPRFGDDFFMFTLSTMKNGTVLLVEVQRVQSTNFGPKGKPVGKFLFLRSQP
jgi:hypothetical protein